MAVNTIYTTKIRTAKPLKKEYKLADGYGLYMLVTPTGGKLWRFKYRFDGKEKLASVGAYPEVTLAEARERRTELRRLVESGIDPSAHKKAAVQKMRQQSSFEVAARAWHRYKKSERTEMMQAWADYLDSLKK